MTHPRTAAEAKKAGKDTYRATDKSFLWSTRQEPHKARNKQLRAKYGKQIRDLHELDPMAFGKTLVYLAVVLTFSVVTREWSWPAYLVSLYFSGIMSHSLFLAVHELTHHNAFKTVIYNDLAAMVANFGIVAPYAMMFKSYHAEHHHYQGWDGVDVDIPTETELRLLESRAGKVVFILFQTVFYAFRPMCVREPKLTWKHALNWLVVGSFDYFWYTQFGLAPLVYMLLSVLFAGLPSPVSGHFISEHFIFDTKNNRQETYSYYGFWNCISFDVGYHNEHHDFPGMPGKNLHKLRKIAPEFYDHLEQTPSWFGASMRFLADDKIGLWARVKREEAAGKRTGALIPTVPEDTTTTPVHS